MTRPDETLSPGAAPNLSRSASVIRAGRNLEARLRERGIPLPELRKLWDRRDPQAWALTPGIYEALADYLRRRGEVFWSYDAATEGTLTGEPSARLRQLQALALADTGAPRAAQRLLAALLKTEGDDTETLSLLARTHKDLARVASTSEEAAAHRGAAREYYERGFQLNREYYPGINAASLAFLDGDVEDARALAREVEASCAEAEEGGDTSVWNVATRGEASLILGRINDAVAHYRTAIDLAGQELNVVASMRRQAMQLAARIGVGELEAIRGCFVVPPITVFSGHRVDEEDRSEPRFPDGATAEAGARIRALLDRIDARIGFASAASGGDILFLEEMLDRGGEVHIVLPMSREAFVATSVVAGGNGRWGARFDAVIERAASVTYASTQDYDGDALLYEYTNDLVFGLALQHSRSLGSELLGVALWDRAPGGGTGSTSDAVHTWRAAGYPVEIVAPIAGPAAASSLLAESDVTFPREAHPRSTGRENSLTSLEGAPSMDLEVKAILFADAVGFSQLTDRDLPAYMTHFMGGIARLVADLPAQPLSKNTWGDAFHFVFDSVRDAGLLALRLRDFARESPWQAWGLERPLGIRIALHAGSVFSFIDPVTGRQNYLGYHINRAARIEPIAEEGQIYASEPFAALAAFRAPDLFQCDYAGQRALAKGFGSDRIFILRPAGGVSG